MPVIDSDAHVVETEHTWDYMDPSDSQYRPSLVSASGEPGRERWMIDGKVRRQAQLVVPARDAAGRSGEGGRKIDAPQETRLMENVEARLRHLDELGIDVQVLYPSIFIEQCADRPEADVAICKGYNRWLTDIWKQGKGRLRWVCAPPLLSMPDALAQVRFSKDNGACAVLMRAIEGDRVMTDPYFYPLYEEASRLNMPIAVHIGNANPFMVDVLGRNNRAGSGFWQFRLMNQGAFFSVALSDLTRDFPQLRIGFIESASQWVPYVLMELRRRMEDRGKPWPQQPLAEWRLYVTCQTNDDVPYVLKYAGEDNLLIGTDYGHADTSTDLEALRKLPESGAISPEATRKILDDNPRAFYGL